MNSKVQACATVGLSSSLSRIYTPRHRPLVVIKQALGEDVEYNLDESATLRKRVGSPVKGRKGEPVR